MLPKEMPSDLLEIALIVLGMFLVLVQTADNFDREWVALGVITLWCVVVKGLRRCWDMY